VDRSSEAALPLSNGYRYYALALLTLVYLVHLLDRILVGLMLEPIKLEFGLSDTQLGFLTGMAFALFYATLGLPIARWADRGNRVRITSLAIGLWGITMTACLFITGFYTLLLARICAAVGEAGCMPPSYSLVGDYFSKAAERARAMAVYMSGSALSSVVGFVGGGWLIENYGWRIALVAIGMLGIALALVVSSTLVEPRATAGASQSLERPSQSLRSVLAALWQQRTTRHLSTALIVVYTLGLGLSPWYAAFMVRNHDMGPAQLGVWFALIFGLGGVAGAILGGHLAGGALRGNERGQLLLTAWSVAFLLPCYAISLSARSQATALAALVPTAIIFGIFLGPCFALLQRLVGDRMRATAMAVVMLLANLIGMGLGPQVVGLLSDWLLPIAGVDSLRYAMLIVACVAFAAADQFRQAARTVRADLERREGSPSPFASRMQDTETRVADHD
jgi:MFS family permease